MNKEYNFDNIINNKEIKDILKFYGYCQLEHDLKEDNRLFIGDSLTHYYFDNETIYNHIENIIKEINKKYVKNKYELYIINDSSGYNYHHIYNDNTNYISLVIFFNDDNLSLEDINNLKNDLDLFLNDIYVKFYDYIDL